MSNNPVIELMNLLASIKPAPKVKGCWHCSRNIGHFHEPNGDKVVY